MKFNLALLLGLFEMADVSLAALRGERPSGLLRNLKNKKKEDNKTPNTGGDEGDWENVKKPKESKKEGGDDDKGKGKNPKATKTPKSKDDNGDGTDDDNTGGNDCDTIDACTSVILHLTFDEFPEEIGYMLLCNGEKIWDKPIGSYPLYGYQFATATNTACIEASKSCILTVLDSFGDGVTSPYNNRPGHWILKVGGEINGDVVIQHNGADADAAFKELSYPAFTIPSSCDGEKGENDDDSSNNNDGVDDAIMYAQVELEMTLDEFPTETGYELVCGDETIWAVAKGTFPVDEPFARVTDDAHVDTSACCIITIYDSVTFGDGLTSPQEGRPGKFAIKYSGEIIAEYDGAKDGGYKELSYQFGSC